MKSLALKVGQSAVIALSCVVVAYFVFDYASRDSEETAEPSPPPPPLTVEFTTLQPRNLRQKVEVVGTIFPMRDVIVTASAAGQVSSMPVHLGDAVADRQTIVELSDPRLQLSLAASRAGAEIARVQLRISQARLEYPEKIVEHIRRISLKGYANAANVDQSETALEIARAEVELAKSRLQQSLTEVQRGDFAIANTRAEAPFAGLVAERIADLGDLVAVGDPLVRVIDISTVIATVHVVERDYAQVEIGQSAEIRVDALAGEIFPGHVLRISPVIDVKTRTAVVLRIDNPQRRLKPGMHSRVSIVVNNRPNAQVTPVASLVESDGQPAVFVLTGEPNIAKKRVVEVGLSDDEYVEILSGLSSDDRIITLGSQVLVDGQPVETASGDTIGKVLARN
jgi:RND family efflux transporter MFP subunit